MLPGNDAGAARARAAWHSGRACAQRPPKKTVIDTDDTAPGTPAVAMLYELARQPEEASAFMDFFLLFKSCSKEKGSGGRLLQSLVFFFHPDDTAGGELLSVQKKSWMMNAVYRV